MEAEPIKFEFFLLSAKCQMKMTNAKESTRNLLFRRSHFGAVEAAVQLSIRIIMLYRRYYTAARRFSESSHQYRILQVVFLSSRALASIYKNVNIQSASEPKLDNMQVLRSLVVGLKQVYLL